MPKLWNVMRQSLAHTHQRLFKGKPWLCPLPGLHKRDNTLVMQVHLKLLSDSEAPAGCARTLEITFKDATNM